MSCGPDLAERLESLREEFDRSFACRAPGAPGARTRFIAIRVGKQTLALRLEQVASVGLTPKLTYLPGSVPGFVGLAAVRGRLVAVYSLASLLSVAPDGEAERWIAYSSRDPSVGLTFGALEGHLLLPGELASPPPAAEQAINHVGQVFEEGSRVRGIVELSSVLAVIGKLARARGPQRGRMHE
jgi:chemotaxis signal transduction protein